MKRATKESVDIKACKESQDQKVLFLVANIEAFDALSFNRDLKFLFEIILTLFWFVIFR